MTIDTEKARAELNDPKRAEKHAAELATANAEVQRLAALESAVRDRWAAVRAALAGFTPPPKSRVAMLFPAASEISERIQSLDDAFSALVRLTHRDVNAAAGVVEAIEARHAKEHEEVLAALAALDAAERAESERTIKALQRAGVKLTPQKGA